MPSWHVERNWRKASFVRRCTTLLWSCTPAQCRSGRRAQCQHCGTTVTLCTRAPYLTRKLSRRPRRQPVEGLQRTHKADAGHVCRAHRLCGRHTIHRAHCRCMWPHVPPWRLPSVLLERRDARQRRQQQARLDALHRLRSTVPRTRFLGGWHVGATRECLLRQRAARGRRGHVRQRSGCKAALDRRTAPCACQSRRGDQGRGGREAPAAGSGSFRHRGQVRGGCVSAAGR